MADLGNGHLDIVTANYSDSTVSVLLGNGAGDFQAAKNFAVGSHPKSVAVASLTGDGKPDIVTANFGSYNGGYGGYGGYGGFGFYGGYNGGTVSVLLGDGHGNFSPDPSSSLGSSPGTFNVGYGPDSVAVAKLTGDGTPDIITANYGSDTVSVLLGNGQGDFSPDPYPTPGFTPGTFAVGYGPKSVAVADVNGDGTLDIITANYIASTVSVLLGNGSGAFSAFSAFSPDPFSSPNLPAGTFAVGSGPDSVAVAANVNGDGTTNIITANRGANTVSVLLSNGQGAFLPAGNYQVGFEPEAVAVVNVTGDGTPEIITANYGDNTVSVLAP